MKLNAEELKLIEKIRMQEITWRMTKYVALMFGSSLIIIWIILLVRVIHYANSVNWNDQSFLAVFMVATITAYMLAISIPIVFRTIRNWRGNRLHLLLLKLASQDEDNME